MKNLTDYIVEAYEYNYKPTSTGTDKVGINKTNNKINNKTNYTVQPKNKDELSDIITRTSRVLNMPITKEAAMELASRSRGTPRIANRLFKRVRDFALVDQKGEIDNSLLEKALQRLKVDKSGLDETDYQLLKAIIERFNGGPVGLDALASSIGEESSTIEDVIEPYLLQEGYLKRTSRGRVVTPLAYKHLNIPYQNGLFNFNFSDDKEGED